MKLEEFGLTFCLTELTVAEKTRVFTVRKQTWHYPDGVEKTINKKGIMRFSLVWRGQHIVDAFFVVEKKQKMIELIVNCPTKKTNSYNCYRAFPTIVDLLSPEPSIEEVIECVCDCLETYTGVNQRRLNVLGGEIRAEIVTQSARLATITQ
jgi:hypothetical protein